MTVGRMVNQSSQRTNANRPVAKRSGGPSYADVLGGAAARGGGVSTTTVTAPRGGSRGKGMTVARTPDDLARVKVAGGSVATETRGRGRG